MKKILIGIALSALASVSLFAELKPFVHDDFGKGDFKLAYQKKAAVIYYDKADFKVVAIAAADLAKDIERVTGLKPVLTTKASDLKGDAVIIGTLGKKGLVDQLAAQKKLNAAGVAGKWEAFVLQTAASPRPGVAQALVIAGSDRRGTAYGVYELSRQIGVSPWYWWADVPAKMRSNLCVAAGRYTLGEPAVKYRGIFINDEDPAFGGWAREKFGGVNSKVYKEIFELLLRLKGNFMWPAMWGKAFYADDPADQQLADDYAIVMGTSHHEPMTRNQEEWKLANKGEWNYERNEAALKEFWRGGIERIGKTEVLVTIGMRGENDTPMSEKGNNIPLLEKIVADQRQIIAEVTKKKPEQLPQVWALYKEVQGYYDQGMRVPDDVTLLLSDDNFGNLRRLPAFGEKKRAGGYGIYYHFDYHGGPRDYMWVNTNPLPKVWEQMNMAYEYGARQIWLVNVGDLKPMELPISFFLDFAWSPPAWPVERLGEYTQAWAEQQFGKEQAAPIAEVLAAYAKYNGRRKPEHLAPKAYSLSSYHEAGRVVAEYNQLAEKAQKLGAALGPEYQDAYYQLVLYPTKACANFLELYVTSSQNLLYYFQGRASANDVGAEVQPFFDRDQAYAAEYHKIAGGKWNHMMDGPNIGYIGWSGPKTDTLPRMRTVTPPDKAEMGVGIQGSETGWPPKGLKEEAVLPQFNSLTRLESYIDVFRRGTKPFDFNVEAKAPWLVVSPAKGRADKDVRVTVKVDWDKAPLGAQKADIVVSGAGTSVTVRALLANYGPDGDKNAVGFIETDGYVSIEAAHFTKAVAGKDARWRLLPDYGRTDSAMTIAPVTAKSVTPADGTPRLEYQVYLSTAGEVKVQAILGPSLNFLNTEEGIRYAVSFDGEAPQIMSATKGVSWDNLAQNNAVTRETKHTIASPGAHVLKIWMVDPGLVLQKIVIDTGSLRPSYLGPPESPFRPAAAK